MNPNSERRKRLASSPRPSVGICSLGDRKRTREVKGREEKQTTESLYDLAVSLPRFRSRADCHRRCDAAAGNRAPSFWLSAWTTHGPAGGGRTVAAHVFLCFCLDPLSTRLQVLSCGRFSSASNSGCQSRLLTIGRQCERGECSAPPGGPRDVD